MSEPESLGAALRTARTALGFGVSDVAARLKVPAHVIEHIEAERFDALPAEVFVRAYIRSYADFVGLDPAAQLWTYDRETRPAALEEARTRPLSVARRVLIALLRMPRGQSWVFAGTVVLITVLAGVFLWFAWPSEGPAATAGIGQPNDGEAPRRVSPAPERPFEAPVAAAPPALPSDPPAPDDPAPPAASDPPREFAAGDATPVPVSGGLTNAPPNESGEAASEPPVALSNPLTYVPGDDHVLVFRFTDDCWVQVVDASGGMLHEDLERAEGELELRGDAPFTITLGYAPGVRLEYNGAPVMLAQHTHENLVAKLVLGL